MPILAIGHIPKGDRVVGMKVGPIKGLRMKEPIANDGDAFRRLRPDLMHQHVIGVHAQEHVWENGVIEDAVMILAFEVADGQCAGLAKWLSYRPISRIKLDAQLSLAFARPDYSLPISSTSILG